jgi:hypothetical protein
MIYNELRGGQILSRILRGMGSRSRDAGCVASMGERRDFIHRRKRACGSGHGAHAAPARRRSQ